MIKGQAAGTTPAADLPANYPPIGLAWSIWGLGTVLYVIGFYQRVAPAVMTSELMAAFGISAAGLGNLAASYYYSYVVMQIPTGILVDSWGPRKVLTFGGLAAAAGTFIFSFSPTLLWANVGRALIGGSVAVGFVAALKIANQWLAPRVFATIAGLSLLVGIIGAVTAGVPLRLLIDFFGWRPSFFALGIVTLAVAGATWIFVHDDPSARGYLTHGSREDYLAPAAGSFSPLSGFRHIFRFRNTWLLALAPGGIIGSILSFSGLWGVPFLNARFDLNPVSGAAVCSMMMICWAIGASVFGALSDRIGRRKPLYFGGCLAATAGWAIIFFLPEIPFSIFLLIAALIGLATGGPITGFAFIKESVPPPLAGTAMGVYNLGMMIGTPILQPVIGWILDLTWAGGTLDGVRIYGLRSYQAGFSVMLFWSLLSCFAALFTKETHCRQSHQ
jgi:MFS family permease